ncbi:hypothetical protein ACF2JD_17585 [Aeromonas sp. A-5]
MSMEAAHGKIKETRCASQVPSSLAQRMAPAAVIIPVLRRTSSLTQ